MLVYIIKSGGSEIFCENRYATINKKGAKKHIIDEILSHERNQKYGDLIEEFAQDGKTLARKATLAVDDFLRIDDYTNKTRIK